MKLKLADPADIARTAELMYKEKHQVNAERHHDGEFVVIEVLSSKAYFGSRPIEAHEKARAESPAGVYHLMKVGQPGAFRVLHAKSRQQSQ